ncbi:MAG TPA: SxtJ family membrane protein [Gemmatimonadaceae bacterium]|nr:SxtJ family membrane protein [Gemmatimonadaceae bacterium]
MAERIPARLTPAEGRRFAFTVGTAFLVLGGVVWWRGHERVATVFAALAAVLLLAGLILPGQLSLVYRAWMGLALLISKVTTPLFMGIVYFLVITPIALIRRATGGNPLVHAAATGDNGRTVWQSRAPDSRRSDLTRQF